jgi:hypothetical protein
VGLRGREGKGQGKPVQERGRARGRLRVLAIERNSKLILAWRLGKRNRHRRQVSVEHRRLELAGLRADAAFVIGQFDLSERRAWKLVGWLPLRSAGSLGVFLLYRALLLARIVRKPCPGWYSQPHPFFLEIAFTRCNHRFRYQNASAISQRTLWQQLGQSE